uniref:DUF6562 domain-containing protein n=2 Tax=Bacteroides TaxID=816 RepID=UPI00101CE91D|nr:DUF6562 domain-containing protein [Bacteroides stercoris]
MKKYHLYLWIIALVGLMTSCSQDETDALPTDTNANRVTLTASLPADFVQPQLKSRALPAAPTDHKLRCILEVWDTEDTPALKIRQEICPSAGDAEIDFSFDLATAGTYKALLWADYIPANQEKSSQEIAGLAGVDSYGNKYYTTTNGLKEVEISITLPIYPEEGDAFFASAEFTKAEKALTIPTVTLTRPFMKLTIAEKNAERFASCKHVIVHFNTLYKFDVATGNATGIKNYGLPAANGHRNYGNDITIGGQTCETLICLYLFANAEDGTMGDIKLEFASSDPDKSLPTVTIPAGIPLKRNYCVNAAGNLIGEPSSSTVNMTVDIDSDWTTPGVDYDVNALVWDGTTISKPADYNSGSPGEVSITTAAELAWLAQQSETFVNYTFKLTADIDLNNYEWTPIGSKFTFNGTFDGQNHTVSNLKCTNSKKGGLFAEIINATVKDVTVSGSVSFNTDNESSILGGIVAHVKDNSTITGCTNRCSISTTGDGNQGRVGGIAGYVANQGNNCNFTISSNTNTGNVSTNGHESSSFGGIIGAATAINSSSITLTGNSYNGGTPSDVCIGYCVINTSTITIDGTGATNRKPYPVPKS